MVSRKLSVPTGSSVELSALTLSTLSAHTQDSHTKLLPDSKSYSDLRPTDLSDRVSGRRLSTPATAYTKSTSLPCQARRRLSPGAPQGGAVFFNHRRKQKSFDMSMLNQDSDDSDNLVRPRSPSPSNDHGDQTSTGSKVYYCDYVVEEILLTERQYVQDLEDIVLGYLHCSRGLLSENDEAEVFGNIEDIYNFHSSFLYDLEICDEEPVAIARCFVDRGKEFEIYAKYVTNYPTAFTSLTKLLRNADIADTFRQQQMNLGHGLPIGSYLHKPVQRILKYHLLLQNLLKHFPEDTVGQEIITSALRCMTDCAKHINEMKRSHEHAMKVQEIQSILYDFEACNLLDFGKLVLEGDLKMYGARSTRHVYLFEKGVIICKKREDGAMSCKTSIMCHNLMLIESIPREPLSFHFVPYDNPRTQYTFQAKTLEQKREWCSMVKKYMLESYNVPIPDKAKELILTLTGKSENDEKLAKHFKAFTLRPHQTPDYIERKRRKSQPLLSSNSCDTLPRSKARVRKTNLNSSMPTALLYSPPGNSPSCISKSLENLQRPRNDSVTASSDSVFISNHPKHPVSPPLDALHERFEDTLSHATSGGECSKAKLADNHKYDDLRQRKGAESCQHSPALAASTDVSQIALPDRPLSAVAANLYTSTPTSSPQLPRRHSLTHIHLQYDQVINDTFQCRLESKSHDENSLRAKQLQRLLDERHGLDDPTWCPEIICIARRYRRPPIVKRADSYAQAQRNSAALSCLINSSLNDADISTSDELGFNELSKDLSESELTSPTAKSRTETSALLNKFSQLKEKTSHRLTDLLKKSPVRIFKDSSDTLHAIDSHDASHIQSMVGKRLSTADIYQTVDNNVKITTRDDSNNNISTEELYRIPVVNIEPSTPIPCFENEKPLNFKPETSRQTSKSSDCLCSVEEDDDIWKRYEPKSRNVLYNSLPHRRKKNKIQLSSSSDNLADVDENEYVNVDFGDVKMTEEITSLPHASTDVTHKDEQTDSDDTQPPDLPPIPEFLLRKRLMKTMSGLDSTLSSLESFAKELKQDESNSKTLIVSLSDSKLKKPTSDFWSALEKYIETGQVDQPVSPPHRALKPNEDITAGHHPVSNNNESGIAENSPEKSLDFTPPKLRSDNLFTTTTTSSRSGSGKVFKMARTYSTRIKTNKDEVHKRLRAIRDKVATHQSEEYKELSGESSSKLPRRIESVRLRRTNSSRIKKFTVMLDSDDEDGNKVDSGVAQCEVDSGSDCNDIYERQTMAALESFMSEDETRDSAIYSDGEESSEIVSPTHSQSPKLVANKQTKKPKLRRSATLKTDDANAVNLKRSRYLPRCQSLPSCDGTQLITDSINSIISRPVSTNLLSRLESLKKSSTFKKYKRNDSLHSKEYSCNDQSSKLIPVDKSIGFGLVQLVKERLKVQ